MKGRLNDKAIDFIGQLGLFCFALYSLIVMNEDTLIFSASVLAVWQLLSYTIYMVQKDFHEPVKTLRKRYIKYVFYFLLAVAPPFGYIVLVLLSTISFIITLIIEVLLILCIAGIMTFSIYIAYRDMKDSNERETNNSLNI